MTTKNNEHPSTASLSKKYNLSRYSIIVPTIESSRSPGPALYGPRNITLIKSSSPQYTIGKRRNFHFPQIPGANVYDCSNYKPGKAAPSYSFGRRYSSRLPPMIVTDYIRH
ncbi:uncharacterized protein ACRADG_013178 [Cochliomyia hominivorax]